ncbi:MAG: ATP-binding protein [bacterium]|nr:ATP-binding protein [bacterium]
MALSHLAHLIDGAIEVRGGAGDVRSFAARAVGSRRDDLIVESRKLSPVEAVLVGMQLAELMNEHPVAGVIGEDAESSPVWEAVGAAESSRRYPVNIHLAFPSGTLRLQPVVIGIEREWQSVSLVGYGIASEGEMVRQLLDQIVAEAGSDTNPFQLRTVTADVVNNQVRFQIVDNLAADRDDVVLPAGVWEDLDRHVHGVFRNHDRLAAAGLATNRGVLLYGPPGTGKTAAVRVLAATVAGSVTVVLCDASVVTQRLGELYGELARLGPTLVVIEDFDRIAPSDGPAMHNLLTTLDGAVSAHSGVVTVATVNDLNRLAPAVRRSARFDVAIEVPLPDRRARAEILKRYVPDGDPVDADAVARVTDGANGADLVALITEAVLSSGSESVTTDLLVRLARGRFDPPRLGTYL